MTKFSLALLCVTGLNAEIYIYNSQTKQPLSASEKQFVVSYEIGNAVFATSRGDDGEIKSLNVDGTPSQTMELVRKKAPSKSAPVAKKVVSAPYKKPAPVVVKVKQPNKKSHLTKFKL